ncbi:MAG: hypothetical protein ACOYM9_22480 [Bradymonadia bacterium]
MTRTALCCLASLVALALGLPAPYAQPAASAVADSGGLPPFLAKMQRQPLEVRVVEKDGAGGLRPAPAGLKATVTILAGGGKVKDYVAQTVEGGVVRFEGIPTNPEVQRMIGYVVSVERDGVRYPSEIAALPAAGGWIEVEASAARVSTADLVAEHAHIDLIPDEENLVVRQSIRLSNRGAQVANLAALPGGGLRIPVPEGGKHPELHDDADPKVVEVRGTDIWFKGALVPGAEPTQITFIYTIKYDEPVYEWSQRLPVRTRGAFVVAPVGRQPGQRVDTTLDLLPRTEGHRAERTSNGQGRDFEVLRMELDLAPDEPLRFAIGGLPVGSSWKAWSLLGCVVAVVLGVVLGFRRQGAEGEARLSRAHLENERDRLLKALARMRKAVERGRLPAARFEREQEAITARLVSLYRALDRLDERE